MSEKQREREQPEPVRVPASEPASEPVSELALVSPVRSMAAISLTFLLFTQVLSRVGAVTLAALLPWAFPAQPDEERIVVPGTAGLVAMLAMTFVNAMLVGLLAGRMAGAMRRWHGVGLGAILGLFAAISMDAVRDFPGWFAIGWLLAPALGASAGGLVAERVAARAPKRLVSERLSPRPPASS
ncbi:MAG: hypothetical protein OHK0013_37250 [Sandaracinaceae bacterium]